jgi:excisionase family DNA binding protein
MFVPDTKMGLALAFVADRAYITVMDMLTTSQAAKVLGSSRQHIVALCNRGELAFSMVGTHRRIERSEIERLTNGPTELRREQLLGLWWGRALAGEVSKNPNRAIEYAQSKLISLRGTNPDSEYWWNEWRKVLDAGPERLMSVLTGTTELDIELRATSPFGGFLDSDSRDAVVRSFQAYWRTRE